jgi:hypothetical protein
VQLVGEEPVHVEDLRRETDSLDLSGRRHVDAIAAPHRRHDRGVGEAVAVAVDLLLRLERLEVLADLHRPCRADAGAAEANQDAHRLLVRLHLFDDLQQLVEALLAADRAEEARRLLLGNAAAEIDDGDGRPRLARGLGRLAVGGGLSARPSLAAAQEDAARQDERDRNPTTGVEPRRAHHPPPPVSAGADPGAAGAAPDPLPDSARCFTRGGYVPSGKRSTISLYVFIAVARSPDSQSTSPTPTSAGT